VETETKSKNLGFRGRRGGGRVQRREHKLQERNGFGNVGFGRDTEVSWMGEARPQRVVVRTKGGGWGVFTGVSRTKNRKRDLMQNTERAGRGR